MLTAQEALNITREYSHNEIIAKLIGNIRVNATNGFTCTSFVIPTKYNIPTIEQLFNELGYTVCTYPLTSNTIKIIIDWSKSTC